MANCFWTDLVHARQVCGSDPAPPVGNLVDAVVMGWGGFGTVMYLNEIIWRDSVMYSPSNPPSAQTEGVWVSAIGPAAEVGGQVRNVVYPGGTTQPLENFTIDHANGWLGTNGEVTIPVLNTAGGSGAFSATGFSFDSLNLDFAGVYAALPPEAKYPEWVDRVFRIPPRRRTSNVRAHVALTMSAVAGATNMQAFNGFSNETFIDGTPTYTYSGMTEPKSTQYGVAPVTPWAGNDYDNVSRIFEANWQPTNNAPVTIDCVVTPEVEVFEPGVIDAYVDELEWFAMEDTSGLSNPFDMPPAGTGQMLSNLAIPVCYVDGEWTLNTWGAGSDYQNPGFRDGLPGYELPFESGIAVGVLKRADNDEVICTMAIYMDLDDLPGGGNA